MKKDRQNIPSINSSRVSFDSFIYQDEAVFLKTDIKDHNLIIGNRLKSLSQKRLETSGASNQNFDLTSSNELFEAIINYLKAVDGVIKILFQKKDEMLQIWTVLRDYENEDKRKAVYCQEQSLMRELMNRKYRFDFNIIEEDEVNEILSSGAILITLDKNNQ